MTTTPVRVQVPGLNLQQEIGNSIRYTSATCFTHSVATPSQYYLIKQQYNFIKITGRFFRKKLLKFYINQGGGGYPIPVKPYQPNQNIVNRFTTLFTIRQTTPTKISNRFTTRLGITRDTLNRTDLPT
ncbi:hypothetical protein OUZ56_008966 [Daphnia magna]|uniref:Uncharacterized protein n=1 Tax=Daphnia magna TaxID=35525 RepID=A0ABR0AEK9_9CRUS|nr:hypothetical protein OUZ56_008966 [Daphnia magna]